MAFGQALNAAGRIEPRPFGAQPRGDVALAAQFVAQLGDAFGLQGRIELDLVDEGRRQDQRRDHQDVEEAHVAIAPSSRRRATAGRGSRSVEIALLRRRVGALGGAQLGGTGARIARGLFVVGDDRTFGQRLKRRVADVRLAARWREPARASPRATRNDLTMRSSSE